MDLQIRQAVLSDIECLFRLDPLAATERSRQTAIEKAVEKRECWVACGRSETGVPIGYGCLEKIFFAEWFIPLVVVSTAHRRSGVARQIIHHLEHCAAARKIFTSTNLSNAPMQKLLEQIGYESSGLIENLDPGDPELIFVKFFDR